MLLKHELFQNDVLMNAVKAKEIADAEATARNRACVVCYDEEVDVGQGVECTAGEDGGKKHFTCR